MIDAETRIVGPAELSPILHQAHLRESFVIWGSVCEGVVPDLGTIESYHECQQPLPPSSTGHRKGTTEMHALLGARAAHEMHKDTTTFTV
jgi:hypothetical protein